MTFGIVLTLNVVGEMYVGVGGAYNVNEGLQLMVHVLDDELEMRMSGAVATTTITTNNNIKHHDGWKRDQMMNEDNILPQTRIMPSVFMSHLRQWLWVKI